MKRILLLLCLAALLLTGCGSQETEFTVEKSGVTYTVNTENGTISGGGYNCRYTLSEDKESVTIRFPNGITQTKYKDQGSLLVNGSSTNDFALMNAADDMADIVLDLTDRSPNWKGLLIAPFCFGLGLLMVKKPHAFFRFKWRWHFQDPEPSNLGLWSQQLSGVILIVLSVILFFISLLC